MHLRLLKFAYQRYGDWPKSYATYEKLNADVFRYFELKGIEGVEKWNAKAFGRGKAESGEGTFAAISDWDILPVENKFKGFICGVQGQQGSFGSL